MSTGNTDRMHRRGGLASIKFPPTNTALTFMTKTGNGEEAMGIDRNSWRINCGE
jgi:hypothetical protein